jgi:hypothetical protein
MVDIKFHSSCQRDVRAYIQSVREKYLQTLCWMQGRMRIHFMATAFTLWPQAILLTFEGAFLNVGQNYVTFFFRRMYGKNKRSQFGCCTYPGFFLVLFVAYLFEIFVV